MKTLKYWIGAAAVWVLTACSGGADYERVLPKDAAAVATVDLKAMAAKAGLQNSEGQVAMNRLADLLKSGLTDSENLIDRIVADPDESGLSLKDRLYLFVEKRSVSAGVLMRVTDEGKLTDLLEMLKEQGVCEALRESDGCTWTLMGKMLVAYNEDAFLLVMDPSGRNAGDMQHSVAKWLRQKREDSFAETEDYQSIQNAKGDISVWASMALLPERAVYPLTMGGSAELRGEDVKALATMNFEAGKLVCDVRSLTTDKVITKVAEEYFNATAPVKGEHLDDFPANTFGWSALRVDGAKLYKWLNSNPTVKRMFEHSMIPLDFHAIFSAVKGDVSFTVTNPLYGDFILLADVVSTDFLQTVEELKPMIAMTGGQMRLMNRGEQAYEFYMMDGSALNLRPGPVHVWFGVKDGKMYFTNRENLVERKVLGLSMRNTEWGKEVEGKRGFSVVNFISLMQTVSSTLRKQQMPPVFMGLDRLDRMTVEMREEDKMVHMELLFKDRNRNVLEQMMALVNLTAEK